jgi:large subunit ribosomal protein L6
MSHIGKKPIEIPEGVTITSDNNFLVVKGKMGELSQQFVQDIKINIEDKKIIISRSTEERKHRELHGLTRALIANMVKGVSEGFSKQLLLVGVGFTADASKGNFLILNLGYSHSIYFEVPVGIKIETPKPTIINISGINKQLVGQVSAKIRSFRQPEPYKGKGVRYSDETVRRKAGKAVGGGA